MSESQATKGFHEEGERKEKLTRSNVVYGLSKTRIPPK